MSSGASWRGPTLLPDPAAAIDRLRERFASRRKVGAAGYPVTNHADVRYVTNYISIALHSDLATLGPTAIGVIWHHWRAVVESVETTLRRGHDTTEYADNEGFWKSQLPALVRLLDDARDDHGALRNARRVRLSFRPVGARGEPYPAWVQDLRERSGVYVIRERQPDGSTPIVYVGESSTDRLHETLTRHFQIWRRWKGYWRGQYGEGHDPGLTYDRDSAEAAVVVTRPDQALDLEARLIRQLQPRDNVVGAVDHVPF